MPARIVFSTLTLFTTLLATSARATTADDTGDIDHLIAAYHQAVLHHDGARLAALFVPQGSAWFSVLTGDALARVRQRAPGSPKIRPGSVQGFIDMVTSSKAELDPEHSNLSIWSDGAMATVTFRFSFLIDHKEQNHGNESWQLVDSADGWRIASIVYSSTPTAS